MGIIRSIGRVIGQTAKAVEENASKEALKAKSAVVKAELQEALQRLSEGIEEGKNS